MTEEIIPWARKPNLPQITPRSVVAGLIIGSLVLISNFQFGLQTGWVSMMSLPSALLAFAVFKSIQGHLQMPFTDVENVFVQSVSVSVGTGPLCFSFVGIIPAIEKFITPEETGLNRPIRFSIKDLILWSLGLGFFGIFFAIPLRKQVVVKEKLPFPSGSATATLISVLHNTEIYQHDEAGQVRHRHKYTRITDQDITPEEYEENPLTDTNSNLLESQTLLELKQSKVYHDNMRNMIYTFIVSSTYTIISYFVPIIRSLPVFGLNMSKNHLWNFQPSPAYIGQGIIMGLPTVSHMLFGAIFGWGILAPMVQHLGWATGPIDDWKTGAQGWILWVSLSIMVSDSIVSFLSIVVKSGYNYYKELNKRPNGPDYLIESPQSIEEDETSSVFNGRNPTEMFTADDEPDEDVDEKYLVSNKVTVVGVILSTVVCALSLKYIFTVVDLHVILASVLLAFFLSILAVRALGETDLNPVSGIGKLSQLLMAFVVSRNHPAGILMNLVAGGIAEAGAQQSGDLMQDLKTGHLIGASPKCQFYAQLIGTIWSVILSSVMYKIYNYVYDIPNELFRIPTAIIWVDCARLVMGSGLPEHVAEFAIVLGIIFGMIALLKNFLPKTHKHYNKLVWLPSGVPVGIGLYNIPSFTLARFVGGVIAYYWMHREGSRNKKVDIIILSSGLVLGEGFFGIVNMVMANLKVPHL